MDRYIYVKSDVSNIYFSENKVWRFKVHLNLPLLLPGMWKVALVEFNASEKSKSKANEGLYIYSDLCKESIVFGEERPLLRRLEKNQKNQWDYSLNNPFYVPVKRKEIQEFNIYIKLADDTEVSYLIEPLYLTLHFKPYPFFA